MRTSLSWLQILLTDKKIGQLNVIPKIFPDLLLRRPRNIHKITSDFDVRAVNNRELWPNFFDKRDQARHLGVICNVSLLAEAIFNGVETPTNKSDIDAARSQRPAFCGPT